MKTKKYQKRIKQAIKALGPEKVQSLRNIFDTLQGTPPQVDKTKYRAQHADEMDVLDQLDHTERWIEHDKSHSFYQISPYALPLIKSKRSENLITIMEECFQILKKMYPSRLKESVTAKEIIAESKHEGPDLLGALYYVSNISGVWSGKGNGFPYEENSTLTINERVLSKNSLFQIYEEHYAHDWRLSKNKKQPLVQASSTASFWDRATPKIKKHPIMSFIGGLAVLITTSYAVTQAIIGFYNLFQHYLSP